MAEDQARVLAAQGVPSFEEASFMASVEGATMKPGGDMVIKLAVPQSEKYNAISLTDAVGIMVVVTARRKRRG